MVACYAQARLSTPTLHRSSPAVPVPFIQVRPLLKTSCKWRIKSTIFVLSSSSNHRWWDIHFRFPFLFLDGSSKMASFTWSQKQPSYCLQFQVHLMPDDTTQTLFFLVCEITSVQRTTLSLLKKYQHVLQRENMLGKCRRALQVLSRTASQNTRWQMTSE